MEVRQQWDSLSWGTLSNPVFQIELTQPIDCLIPFRRVTERVFHPQKQQTSADLQCWKGWHFRAASAKINTAGLRTQLAPYQAAVVG